MAITGRPRATSFHKKWKFTVAIDGFQSAAFQKCSGLKASLAKVEYHEGGTVLPYKAPGRMTVDDVTLERGACYDPNAMAWFRDTMAMRTQRGLRENAFKRNFDVIQWDRDDHELRRWRVFGAWPLTFEGGDWDNESDDIVIEKLTLAIDFFDLVVNNVE